jgi:phosphoglycerate kinase
MVKRIADVKNLKGKRILLRLDLNVPIEDGRVVDDYRIKKSFATISYLQDAGAKIIIVSHIENNEGATLRPVYECIKKDFESTFEDSQDFDVIKNKAEDMKNGEIMMLENLRRYPGEKENDETFSRSLASIAEIFVNDAFAVSHRAHASVVGVTRFLPSFAGFLMSDEVHKLAIAFHPPKPFTFILGGAKFETKLPLLKKFLKIADVVYLAGALANDGFKAKGFNVGKSRVSANAADVASIIKNKKLVLPVDVVVKTESGEKKVKKLSEIADSDIIWDAGPQSLKELEGMVKHSKFVLWNGTLGNCEEGFKEGTLELAKIIAKNSTASILGGGDTVAAISELKLEDKFDFVSTGGGAMLDYLANETLPGIEVLKT